MLTFQSFECLSRLGPHDPAYPVIHELLDSFITPIDEHGHSYDPDSDGYIVLIDREDADPSNSITSEKYYNSGEIALNQGDYGVAKDMFNRSLINAQVGYLGKWS